jgi:hypothetical protein
MLELDACWVEHEDWRGFVLTVSVPELVERHAFRTFVAGVAHRLAEAQGPAFAPGSSLELRPEPDNPFDRQAVAVWDSDGITQAGYIPRAVAAELHHLEGAGAAIVLDEVLEDGRRVGIGILVAHEEIVLRVVEQCGHGRHEANVLRRRALSYRDLDRIHATAVTDGPMEQMARALEELQARDSRPDQNSAPG